MSFPVDSLLKIVRGEVRIEDRRYTLTDTVSPFLQYIGKNFTQNASQAAATWQIQRILTSGSIQIKEFADNGNYTQIWNNRNALFGAFFANNFSTEFDSINDYVSIPHAAAISFDRLNAFSFSAWVKTPNASNQHICDKKSGATGLLIRMPTAAGFIEYELANAGANRIRVTSTTLPINDGNWHHICVTYTGSSAASGVAIYRDAVAAGLTINNDTLTLAATNAVQMVLGADSGGAAPRYLGNIDEVCIFDVALTPTQVTELYNSGAPGNLDNHTAAASRRAWWRMGDDTTFPTISDEVGTNHATMNNMAAGNFESEVPP